MFWNFISFASSDPIKKQIGSAIIDKVAKLIAVKAGEIFANAGINAANPVLVEQINVLNKLANEPTIMNGMKVVKAFLIAPRYLLSSTFSATIIKPSSNFSVNFAMVIYHFLLQAFLLELEPLRHRIFRMQRHR